MAKSALEFLAESTKDKTYTYTYEGEEYEYTFRMLDMKDTLRLAPVLEKLSQMRVGREVSAKEQTVLVDAIVKLVKTIWVVPKGKGLVVTDAIVFRFLLQVTGGDILNSELMDQISYHVNGQKMSKETAEEIENQASKMDEEGKKKVPQSGTKK